MLPDIYATKKPGVIEHRAKEDCMKNLTAYRVVFGVAVSTPSGDEMHHPAKQSG